MPLLSAAADQCARALGLSSGPWGCGLSRTALSAACRSRYWSIRSSISRGKGGTGPTSFCCYAWSMISQKIGSAARPPVSFDVWTKPPDFEAA